MGGTDLPRMVQSRIAEGLNIERTLAALPGHEGAHAAGVHGSGRGALGNQHERPAACGGTPEATVARARRAVKQSIAVTVLT